MDWFEGFMENVGLKIMRYNLTSQRAKIGTQELSATRSVANWVALQAITKEAANDDLVVYVKDLAKFFTYRHADLRWYSMPRMSDLAAKSIMWIGASDIQYLAYVGAGVHPLQTARRPYFYNAPTFTNMPSFIKGFRAAAGNGTGSGTLTFNKTNKTLQWTPPGGSIGAAVNVSAGGWFRLEGSVPDKEVVVSVFLTNEPAASQTDSITISGRAGMPCNISSTPGLFHAMNGYPFGEQNYYFTMNGNNLIQTLLSISQWEGVATDLTYVDLLTGSPHGTAAGCNTTLASLLTLVKARQAIGSKVIVAVPFQGNGSSDAVITFTPYLVRKLQALAEIHGFEIADATPWLSDIAGTVSNPSRASCFNSSDLQYLNVRGQYLFLKYGLMPILSKYLPKVHNREVELIPYSATENFGNLLTNGRLTGTAGAKGATITGDVPTSYTVTRTGTATAVCTAPDSASPIARDDAIPGKYFRMEITGGADGDRVSFAQTTAVSASNYAAGDIVQLSGEIRFKTVSGGGFYTVALYIDVGGTVAQAAFAFTSALAANSFDTLDGDTLTLNFKTEPMTLLAGVSSLNIFGDFQVKAGAVAQVDIAQNLCLKKIVY